MPGADLDPGALAGVLVEVVRRNWHLYLISATFWVLVATFLGLRYPFGRRASSDRLRVPIVLLGGVAVTAAAADVAIRADAGITHVSLVAYLATPLGIGRYVVARWDGRHPGPVAALGLRLATYTTAFVSFVALAALGGTPWVPERPQIDRSSPEAILLATEWMPFMATVFALMIVADTVLSLASISTVPRTT